MDLGETSNGISVWCIYIADVVLGAVESCILGKQGANLTNIDIENLVYVTVSSRKYWKICHGIIDKATERSGAHWST